ncbi:Retrovirus-related Pol polyprotein LINE-1 [Quillaja saponaria]|uniref:Retrovirus-related Pol polyprotein LINE-1 n=1 Tax=Quillaja saponaria TaxID=32244 RepID=A0AAD7PYW9_QUISA|nr:Retrovirus-related Pol polyprotein LINE-1 [Quillaja saponaria]
MRWRVVSGIRLERCYEKVEDMDLQLRRHGGGMKKFNKLLKLKKCYKRLHKCRNEDNYRCFRQARKVAKKAVREARGKACEGLYQKLETKDGEKDIYRITKQRERRTKDLIRIKCIKDEADRVLVKEDEINERWRTYFDTLFNEESMGDFGDLDDICDDTNRRFVRRIRAQEVKEVMHKMKNGKALGPDDIPIEVWRYLGDIGVTWLINLSYKILVTKKMPDEWRKIKKQHSHKMGVAEMRMLRWMTGHTRKDRIRNEEIRKKVEVAPIKEKMRKNRLRWFGHIQRRPMDAVVKQGDLV